VIRERGARAACSSNGVVDRTLTEDAVASTEIELLLDVVDRAWRR
jgi:hypothetical protein